MAKAVKVSMFSVDDVIITSLGEATVTDVRGCAWVKVSGVKRSWWPTTELAPLNPEFAEKYEATLAEAAGNEQAALEEKEAAAKAKAEEKAAAKKAKAEEKAAARKAKKEAEAAAKAAAAEEAADQAQEPVTA